MKKVFLLIGCLMLCSCSAPTLNNDLPMKSISVAADYGNIVSQKMTITLSENIDLSKVDLKYKSNPKKSISTLLPGDQVEVYYKSEDYNEIDHALVTDVKDIVLKVSYEAVPGTDGYIEVFFSNKNDDIRLNYADIDYAINKDGSFVDIQDLKDSSAKLYGTYLETDYHHYTEPYEYTTIKLNALYTYNPR